MRLSRSFTTLSTSHTRNISNCVACPKRKFHLWLLNFGPQVLGCTFGRHYVPTKPLLEWVVEVVHKGANWPLPPQFTPQTTHPRSNGFCMICPWWRIWSRKSGCSQKSYPHYQHCQKYHQNGYKLIPTVWNTWEVLQCNWNNVGHI